MRLFLEKLVLKFELVYNRILKSISSKQPWKVTMRNKSHLSLVKEQNISSFTCKFLNKRLSIQEKVLSFYRPTLLLMVAQLNGN